MTLTLELTAEEEAQLRAKAAKAGLDEASYVRSLISDEGAKNSATMTPAEIVGYWEANGLLAGYGDPDKDSTEVARELREKFSVREHPA